MTFNTFFTTDFTTYNNNGIESFKSMLQSKGFKEQRSDWFIYDNMSTIKYVFRNEKMFISFSHQNDNRIEISDYKLN